jgi:hypothetical protein
MILISSCTLAYDDAKSVKRPEKVSNVPLSPTDDKLIIEDLKRYIESFSPELLQIEQDVMNTYASYTGDNFKSDQELFQALRDEIIPDYRNFVDGIEKISPQTKELIKIHELCIDGANKQLNGFIHVMQALVDQSYSELSKANDKLAEGRKQVRTFTNQITQLRKKYNLE